MLKKKDFGSSFSFIVFFSFFVYIIHVGVLNVELQSKRQSEGKMGSILDFLIYICFLKKYKSILKNSTKFDNKNK
jgi:hypothetical protein